MIRKTVEMPMQCRLAAVSSIDTEQRTLEVVWSTGAAVRRFDWITERPFVEELSMDASHVRLDRLNSGAPVLDSHDRYELSGVLGVVERAWIENGEGRARVRFSSRTEVDPVWRDVQDGILRNVSVGYQVLKFVDATKPEDSMKRLLAVDWEPMEISLVAIGADAKAGVRAGQASACEIEMEEGGVPDSAPPAEAQRVMQMARLRLDLAEREI